jgi:hypothetical protein
MQLFSKGALAGPNSTKLFIKRANKSLFSDSLPFQSSIMFKVKPGAYSRGEHLEVASLG